MEKLTREQLDSNLSFLIGQIQRADVIAEDGARAVWLRLVPPGLAHLLLPRDFGRVLEDLTKLLNGSGASRELKAVGSKLIGDAKKIHEKRNELVHDQWIYGSDGKWKSGKTALKKSLGTNQRPRDLLSDLPEQSLLDFEKCLTSLRRLNWQLSSFEYVVERGLEDEDAAANFEFEFEVMSDHFAMAVDGMTIHSTRMTIHPTS